MDEQKEKTQGGALDEETLKELENAKALHDEMEELAAVFQEELDRTKQEAMEGTLEKPQEASEEISEEKASEEAQGEEESTDIPEDCLCDCCGTNRRGTKENPDSLYCEECEAGLRHYPFDLLNIILVLAALVLVFYGGFVFANHAKTYAAVLKADQLLSENKLYSALDSYSAAANTMINEHINGELVYKRELLTLYKLGGMNLLPETQNKIKPFEFKLPHFRALRLAIDDAEGYMATAAAGNGIVAPYEAKKPEEIPYDQLIADLEALKSQTPEDLEREEIEGGYIPATPSYRPAMIAFYKYYVALLCEKDVETQLQFAEEIREADPNAIWIYGSVLGDLYAKSGKDVEPICKQLEDLNAEDDTPALLRVASKRIAKNPEEAIQLAEEQIKAGSNMSPEFLRQQALCYLALEDYENAFQKANAAFEMAFSNGEPSVQLCDTYALCAAAAQKDKEYADVEKIFKESHMTVSSEVQEFRNGTRTLASILEEGDCDL